MLKWYATRKWSYLGMPWTTRLCNSWTSRKPRAFTIFSSTVSKWDFHTQPSCRPVFQRTGCNCSHNQSRLVLSGCSCSCRELGCPQTGHSLVVPKKGKKPDWTRLLNTILAHPTTQANCCHHPHPCAPHPILALILTCPTTQQQQWPCCLCMTILLSLSPLSSCLLVLSLSCPHTSDNMTTMMTLPLHNNIVISIPSISLPSPSPSSSCIQQCDNSNMQGQWQQWCCFPCMTMLLSSSSSALAPCSYPAGILPAVGTSMGL